MNYQTNKQGNVNINHRLYHYEIQKDFNVTCILCQRSLASTCDGHLENINAIYETIRNARNAQSAEMLYRTGNLLMKRLPLDIVKMIDDRVINGTIFEVSLSCPLVYGKCNHVYHDCCLQRYKMNMKSKRCPLHYVEWVEDKYVLTTPIKITTKL